MLVYREVHEADLELICRHRHEMFKSSGRTDEMLAAMTAAFRAWLAPRLVSKTYFGWIAELDGSPVGGVGMMVIEWPPHPAHPSQDARGYVLNMFVEPEHRRRGIARALMQRTVAEARRRNIQYMVLHATRMARGMYEQLGWEQTREMSLSPAPR